MAEMIAQLSLNIRSPQVIPDFGRKLITGIALQTLRPTSVMVSLAVQMPSLVNLALARTDHLIGNSPFPNGGFGAELLICQILGGAVTFRILLFRTE